MNPKQLPLISAFLLFVALLVGISLFLPPLQELPTIYKPDLVLGKETQEFNDLITRIKRDIGQEKIEIKVFIGPYFKYAGILGRLIDDYHPRYVILFDIELYNKLTRPEREALVAHEAGHILFKYPKDHSLEVATEVQVLADKFAAKYVSPDHIISPLNKLYAEYWTRVRRLKQINPSTFDLSRFIPVVIFRNLDFCGCRKPQSENLLPGCFLIVNLIEYSSYVTGG
ncbi:MAG: hypothetical protein AAB799_02070 [Patescibacteria group bacterium]